MADSSKMRNLILIVLIILSLVLAGGIYLMFQKEHAVNVTLQGQLEDVKAKQKTAESRLEDSKKMIADMEAKLQDAQNKIDSLSSDLQKEKGAKQDAISQIDQLKADLDSQKEARDTLQKKLDDAQGQVKKANDQLKTLEDKRAELEAKIKDLEAKSKTAQGQGGVELGTIVVAPEGQQPQQGQTQIPADQTQPPQDQQLQGTPTPAPASAQEGKVLVVNKDYNFAVLNLGNKDGVAVGNVYSIYHGNKYLGDVKVEKVHDSMAAAGFLSPEVKDKVSEGDKAVLKAK